MPHLVDVKPNLTEDQNKLKIIMARQVLETTRPEDLTEWKTLMEKPDAGKFRRALLEEEPWLRGDWKLDNAGIRQMVKDHLKAVAEVARVADEAEVNAAVDKANTSENPRKELLKLLIRVNDPPIYAIASGGGQRRNRRNRRKISRKSRTKRSRKNNRKKKTRKRSRRNTRRR